MKGCVIGAGPTGLYAAKYISAGGVPVAVYDKAGEAFGNYKYARTKASGLGEILQSDRVDLHLNTDASQICNSDCSFYVMATGAVPRALEIPGGQLARPGMQLVRQFHDASVPYLGKDLCIIGMGNVSLDILEYVHGKCESVTVLSSRSAQDAPFDNHLLRELIDGRRWKIRVKNAQGSAVDDASAAAPAHTARQMKSRASLLSRIGGRRWWEAARDSVNRFLFGTPKLLTLVFNSRAQEICDRNGSYEVTYSDGKEVKKGVFDLVVSSIGFVPQVPALRTDKPIFRAGWCVDARGSLNEARAAALSCATDVLSWVRGKETGSAAP
ncbi:hypothetical protein PAPHI01_0984 [Pancytospora philotis]|nr:hypothetical protein PAPHI01_0984 [Pancytospora philotis]